jgi:hypothetical protein
MCRLYEELKAEQEAALAPDDLSDLDRIEDLFKAGR